MRFGLHVAWQLAAMGLVMEVICRFWIGRPTDLTEDPRYGKITVPGSYVVQSFEGFSRGRVNSLGNLDDEIPSPPPPDGILVLGDSFTEARHVRREDRFTDRLAALTSRRVYNVGHAGWSPVNALGYLEALGDKFSPQTIVLQVSANDLTDLVATKRAHVEQHDGKLQMVIPMRQGAQSTLRTTISRSALAGELIAGFAGLAGGEKADDDGRGSDCAMPRSLVIEALPWLFGQLGKLGAREVAIVYIPRLDYHAGCFDRCPLAADLFRAAAAASHTTFVDPTAAMCEVFAATGQPLNGFWNTIPGTGHINSEGHRVVATELAKHLAR